MKHNTSNVFAVSKSYSKPPLKNGKGPQQLSCFQCGKSHLDFKNCFAKELVCFSSRRKGHQSSVCRFTKPKQVQELSETETLEQITEDTQYIARLMHFDTMNGVRESVVSSKLWCIVMINRLVYF